MMASANYTPARETLPAQRDHLFISYASEDLAFVRWLALKLSLSGYRVWWDRANLLGGDPFPSVIDQALKTSTFRLLAVLSTHSTAKGSPRAERAMARRIAEERGENFLIPLNHDLTPTEMSWAEADLTAIDFKVNWASGLRELLRQLRVQCAPCFPGDASILVNGNLGHPGFMVPEPEPVWLNLFSLIGVPDSVNHYTFDREIGSGSLGEWVYRSHAGAYWSFETPPALPGIPPPCIERRRLSSQPDEHGNRTIHIATDLLRQHVERRCRSLGLVEIDRSRTFYFPASLDVADRLPFTLPTGRKTWLKPVGTKKVWHGTRPEEVQHHLAFTPRIELRRYGQPVLQIRPTIHFTTKEGAAIDTKKNVRRAKAVRRNWFNDKWLARICAIGNFLATEQDHWCLGSPLTMQISRQPLTLTVPLRLDEEARKAARSHEPEDDAEEDDVDLHLDDLDSEETDD